MFKPIIPWLGGKRRLADKLLPLFPAHTCYVEPFCGAAALFFLKTPSKVEVLNDINGELVNLYRVVQNHLEEFVRQFKWALTSRQIYEWHQMARPEILTDIQRAARFYYLQKLSFGAKVTGQSFGTAATAPPRLNLLRIEEELSAAHVRLANVYVENLSWEDCIQRYDRKETLHFCDPPYWDTEGYGVEFGLAHYRRMAELARSIQGHMIITVNDHPVMRETFAGLPMETVGIKYSLGSRHGTLQQTGELIIRNREGGFGGNLSLI